MVHKWYIAPEELFEDKDAMRQWAIEALESEMRSNKN